MSITGGRSLRSGIYSATVNAELDFDRAFLSRCHAVLDATRSDDAYDRVFYFFEKIHLLNLLDRLDVQSMTASVEARVPFVDHELVEFVWSIPLKYKMRWKSPLHRLRACFTKSENASEHLDVSKYLLRRVADGKLPPQISRRKSLAFRCRLMPGSVVRCRISRVRSCLTAARGGAESSI